MKNKVDKPDWRPTTSQEVLIARSALLSTIRHFFQAKAVLEVSTPTISRGTITDVYLEAMTCSSKNISKNQSTYYLQTSPEFAMKRLLCAGSGSIYQICHAYRDEEAGRYHNPEFTLLEWYRIGFNHVDLMSEVDELLQVVLGTEQAEIISYQNLFLNHLQIDPLKASAEELQKLVSNDANGPTLESKDEMLHCLFSILIEPKLAKKRPLIVCDFPASQSALARISTSDPRVSERFEVYFKGIELANGFHELKDVKEQRKRFEADNHQRKRLGKSERPIDETFLDALSAGLPDCAGIALGIDRLLMLKLGKKRISDVITFPIDIA